MPTKLLEIRLAESLAAHLQKPPTVGLEIHWLGQAGFVVDVDGRRIVIDPYLSDSLAAKYRGTSRPHTRLMPPPVAPGEIPFVDLVLCTHAHTDHMDPATLPSLLAANPNARLVAPKAVREQAIERSGVGRDRLLLAEAGAEVPWLSDISILPTRAAHETLKVDPEGNHHFLGYCLRTPHANLWHSGDCIPFDGLKTEIRQLRPDITLLPVNGRRPELSQNGVPGNFTLAEAIDITRETGARHMIAHHYGLFDFNTEDPDLIDDAAQAATDPTLHRAKDGVLLRIRPS